MKSIRPEDRGKAAALVVGVIVVFAVVFMRLSAALGGAPQPAPGAPVTEAIAGPGSTTPGAAPPTPVASNATPGKKADDLVEIQPVAPTQVEPDPFRPAPKSLETSKPAVTPSVGSQPTAQQTKSSNPASTQLKGPISEGNPDQNAAALPKVGEVQPDVVPMALTGIVDGGAGKPIALITVGSHDYAVTLGDSFGDGFRLEQAAGIKAIVSQHHVLRTIAMPIPLIN